MIRLFKHIYRGIQAYGLASTKKEDQFNAMVYQIDKKWVGWDLNLQPERFPNMIHNRTSLEQNIMQTTICGGFYARIRSQIRCPMKNMHEDYFH